MATKGKKISEVALENKLTELDGSELVPMAKNGSNAVADTNTIKEFAQDGLDDKYVEKEDGKGLSSNDFTDADKAKLDGIDTTISEAIADNSEAVYIDDINYFDIADKIYAGETYLEMDVAVVNSFLDKVGKAVADGRRIFLHDGSTSTECVIENVRFNDGIILSLSAAFLYGDNVYSFSVRKDWGSINLSKGIDANDLPTKVSELQNDAKYQTGTQIENRLAILYESLDSQLVDEYTHLDNKKVDKVEGKQLSTEDFTTLLKQKLDGLTNYDDSTLTSELNALKSRLDTLVGSGDVTAVIDTFQEIENFLQGVTNTQTLTGLLQEMKSEIVALCADTYANKSRTFDIAKSVSNGKYYIGASLPSEISQYAGGDGFIECRDSFSGWWNWKAGKYIVSGGTSSQFLKADGSVDSTAYLPTASYTASDVLDKVKSVDGAGSGLDADLLDGKQPADLNVGSAYKLATNLWPSDLNTIGKDTAIYLYRENTPNSPSTYGTVLSIGGIYNSITKAGYQNQLAFDSVKIQIFYRRDTGTWKQLAFTDSNVASADKLTTKNLTNEDLNNIKDVNFSSYCAYGNNTCANKPNGVYGFYLLVSGHDGTYVTQTLIQEGNPISYKRNLVGNTWTAWKKMLTEDDITKIVQVSALPSNPDSNTLYVIPE